MNMAVESQGRFAAYPWLEKIDPQKAWLRGRWYLIAKRMMDLTVLILALPFLLPVMGLCALFIIIESPGASVIFSQKRTGKDGLTFKMYKFRTMVPNAEAMKAQLAHLNELQWPDFKITNDPRITRVGKILRKTSLDELPQLWNVFKGEMSLVGPRPTSFSAKTYKLWQTERLDVQPGLTGLWQIIGRGETEFDERLKLDIAYIEKRCLWLDIQLLFRTVGAVLRRKGAH
jgi:lipopolysaccharide/colanic/teichoic acid biosynthesis glycosyltransferase